MERNKRIEFPAVRAFFKDLMKQPRTFLPDPNQFASRMRALRVFARPCTHNTFRTLEMDTPRPISRKLPTSQMHFLENPAARRSLSFSTHLDPHARNGFHGGPAISSRTSLKAPPTWRYRVLTVRQSPVLQIAYLKNSRAGSSIFAASSTSTCPIVQDWMPQATRINICC